MTTINAHITRVEDVLLVGNKRVDANAIIKKVYV